MQASALVRRRVVVAADAFVELMIWQVPEPVLPSMHWFKYSMAYVVEQRCVVRYDNERGKGDHRHTEVAGGPYAFSTPDQLMADFAADVARWNDDHGRA